MIPWVSCPIVGRDARERLSVPGQALEVLRPVDVPEAGGAGQPPAQCPGTLAGLRHDPVHDFFVRLCLPSILQKRDTAGHGQVRTFPESGAIERLVFGSPSRPDESSNP